MRQLIAAAVLLAAGAAAAAALSDGGATVASGPAAANGGYMKNLETLSWSPVDGAAGYALVRDATTVAQAGAAATTARFQIVAGTHTIAAWPIYAATADTTTAATSTTTTADAPPYDAASAWNTPVPSSAAVDAKSQTYMNAIADNNLPLTSDPDQYTIPVYAFSASTPPRTVTGTGFFSSYDAGDNSRVGHGSPWTVQIPVPAGSAGGVGSDGQLELYDPAAGVQYGFWQFSGPDSAGVYHATNGYRYHTGPGYNGRFADGLAGRGAGTPYLAGLVRKWEVDQGHIDHALAFAYNSPSSLFVYPASKSDGGRFGGVTGTDPPEGSRIQLDPNADLASYSLTPAALVIAHALQRYGMIVVDHSGSSKVYLEDSKTAGWDATVTRLMLSSIPWSAFRVVDVAG